MPTLPTEILENYCQRLYFNDLHAIVVLHRLGGEALEAYLWFVVDLDHGTTFALKHDD
jgi:hypothetical protein